MGGSARASTASSSSRRRPITTSRPHLSCTAGSAFPCRRSRSTSGWGAGDVTDLARLAVRRERIRASGAAPGRRYGESPPIVGRPIGRAAVRRRGLGNGDRVRPECVADVSALGTDGSGAQDLIVPAGGFRARHTDAAHVRSGDHGAKRAPADLYMDGLAVFNFTLKRIPDLVNTVLDLAEWPRESVDAYMFTRPTRSSSTSSCASSSSPSSACRRISDGMGTRP